VLDAAAALGRSQQTIRNWISAGRMRGHRARTGFTTSALEVDRLRTLLGVSGDHKAA
jgi:transposase